MTERMCFQLHNKKLFLPVEVDKAIKTIEGKTSSVLLFRQLAVSMPGKVVW